jgi:hypothetical protein
MLFERTGSTSQVCSKHHQMVHLVVVEPMAPEVPEVPTNPDP